jgi:hydroxyethylthiazole kinase
MLSQIAQVLKDVRESTPLVQCITNYVTINDCANILLGFGASPAMCEAQEEVEQFVGLASALYLNLGTLTGEQKEAALLAARKAAELGKPVVLDPVACGAIPRKVAVSRELLESARISVIKGNIGEIKSLAGFSGRMRGVDSLDEGEGVVDACRELALKYRTVVVATGKRDIISDGERCCVIDNGHQLLTLITGAGCMAGALTAATAAVGTDLLVSSAAAIMAICLAGERAAASLERPLPGSFRVKLFDAIYCLTGDDILQGGKIRWM